MSTYQTPTFETSEFDDKELTISSKYSDESLLEYAITVRWCLNFTFDKAGVWAMYPEITWVEVVATFEVDESESDPQKQRNGDTQRVDFTPATTGWTIDIETFIERGPQNAYRCTHAYIDIDSQTANIIFE